MARIDLYKDLFDATGVGLEIGPSHCPVLPKKDGYRVEIVDHASAEKLREKYAAEAGVGNIEEVDFIWSGEPLHELIDKAGHYDFIFSSHNIEHQTDFLGHLVSCSKLLKPDGVLVMAVPDMRFIFDAMRNPSTTGEVLKAYHEKRTRHCPAIIFDGFADAAHLGALGAWYYHQRGPLLLRDPIENAKNIFDRSLNQPDNYIDAHGWCFTPTSFRLIMRDLNEMDLCDLKIGFMRELGHLEFHVVLSRNSEFDTMSRVELKRHLIKERAISAVQLLGGSEELRRQLYHELTIGEDVAVLL